MIDDTPGYIERNEPRDVIVSGQRIGLKDIEQIFLSHECVLDAKVASVPDEKQGSLLLPFVTLKKGYAPSDDLKRELAWYVGTEVGCITLFKDLKLRVTKSETSTMPTVERSKGGKDVFITGHRINTAEVEQALKGLEDVVEATVIGVPDKKKGEMLKAFVTLREGCAPSNDLKRELAWHARLEVGPMVLFKDIEFGGYSSQVRDERVRKGMVIVDKLEEDGREVHISSHRISTTEVAKALLGHPDVSDAAVVTVPDDRRGEVMKAFVRLNEGVVPSNDLKLELAWYVMTELKPISVFNDIDLVGHRPGPSAWDLPDNSDQETIYISGHTILSADVERALMYHDAVSETVVIGVPDERHGEALQAFVALREGVIPSDDLKEELAWHARTEIGPAVVFKSIEFRRFLPRTETRKTLRSILRADALNIPTRMAIHIAD